MRSPIPKHAVVFINGPSSTSRARASAARLAGTRVMYIEKDGLGTCDADDLVDGVVESIGTEDDWEMVTLDDISTPGSFWLNPPNPRDDSGDRVDPEDVVAFFLKERNAIGLNAGESLNLNQPSSDMADDLSEKDLEDILADLDSL